MTELLPLWLSGVIILFIEMFSLSNMKLRSLYSVKIFEIHTYIHVKGMKGL